MREASSENCVDIKIFKKQIYLITTVRVMEVKVGAVEPA
jgi:hypothetical protein